MAQNTVTKKPTDPKKTEWPKVRPRGDYWQVDCGIVPVKGKLTRFRKNYKSKVEAEAAAQRFRDERRQLGASAFALTPEQRQICLEAFKVLTGFPEPTLIDAARFYKEHHDPGAHRRTVNEVLTEFLESKRTSGKANVTILDYNFRLGNLAKDHGKDDVHAVTVQTLEKWMDKRKLHGISRANFQRNFVVFFNYALKRGYCKLNPAAALEKVQLKETEPVIMPQDQVINLLTVTATKAPQMIPYYILGLFAGIRPDEIKALDWRNVNFERKEIKVTSESAKTRDARYVRMSPNLIAWLLPHRKLDGQIFFSKRFFSSTRKKSGVTWANDIMRHTYASNHCVIHGTDDTADQLGHKGKSMLFKHYRRAVSESEAKLFWEIRPSVKDNVVEFKTA